MNESEQKTLARSCTDVRSWPIMICLLGNFRLLRAGRRVTIHGGGKAEVLLAYLGLQGGRRVARERLAQILWPDSDLALALHSLNNVIYSLRRLLDPALHGADPVLHEDGYYRLNVEAGIGVDVACFESLAQQGDAHTRAGDPAAAVMAYQQAADLYRGELCITSDVQAIVERERLRARYLRLLGQIADYYYSTGDYLTCLTYAWLLLARDPYREDAHRLAMRCYVRRGERAAALHQYQVCADLLRAELNVEPEPATLALLEQIRDRPESI